MASEVAPEPQPRPVAALDVSEAVSGSKKEFPIKYQLRSHMDNVRGV